jgi:hypothetical protein
MDAHVSTDGRGLCAYVKYVWNSRAVVADTDSKSMMEVRPVGRFMTNGLHALHQTSAEIRPNKGHTCQSQGQAGHPLAGSPGARTSCTCACV